MILFIVIYGDSILLNLQMDTYITNSMLMTILVLLGYIRSNWNLMFLIALKNL